MSDYAGHAEAAGYEGDYGDDGDWWDGQEEGRDAKKYEMLLVEVYGMTKKVEAMLAENSSGSMLISAEGKVGRAIDWSDEKQTYCVFTFDGFYLDIPEENLREYEPPLPQDGGFDACWPYYVDNTFFDFCADVNNVLLAKNYCLIQMSKTDQSRQEALSKARRKDFEAPRDEFLVDFLGRKGRGKTSHMDPLELTTPTEVESLPEPANELQRYDRDISELFGTLGPMTWDSQGFNSAGRTEGMVWLPFSSAREENTLTPEPLTEDDIELEGLVERHLHFLRRRKLCFLYLVDGEGGQLALYPREDLQAEPIELPAQRGRLLVFRCDRMSFKYQPVGPHLTLLAWALTDPPKLNVGDFVASTKNLDDILGIYRGPSIPLGERAHIMSIACITGGAVYNTEDALSMYLSGTDAHWYVPQQRFDTDVYFTKGGEEDHIPGVNSYHKHGGLVYDLDIMSFDNEFFGITEYNASLMWPNQRKALEVGYECLYGAGYSRKTLRGQPILVYMGDCGAEWWGKVCERIWAGENNANPQADWEGSKSYAITAARLSHTFDLHGPTWLCDTACSSGLTAFCTAMYSMKRPTERGTESPSMDVHCKGAVSGGVNMIVDASVYLGNSASHMLSMKGRCFTFDASGDGYARGEGCSMAYTTTNANQKDAEMQYGCAIGNKVNQDGKSASMTAPNGPAQQLCIKASLQEAGVMPHDITGSECHGTGTSLGDPIEVGSLRGVQETDDRNDPMINTSSKSNIGHLEANAGVTGLFKCILMGRYGVGLPNCHMRGLNPHLDISGWPAYMISETSDLSANSALTGVSSFGISGTNAHAECWAMCRMGPHEAGRRMLSMEKLHQFTLTCPVTLGPIDHLTGEPARGDGRKYHADVLREELADYTISTYAYEGSFRYRREALPDDTDDMLNPEGARVCICGSWSGWSSIEEMEQQEDGSYMRTVILGETRCERFYICVNENSDYRFYPIANNAGQCIWIEGPDTLGAGKHWIIDGRDEEVPGLTVYQVRFWWGKLRKRVAWEEVSPKFAADALHYEHRYQVLGTWTSWTTHELMKDPDNDDVWEYSLKVGLQGEEEFQLCRDHDKQQLIYPSKPHTTKASVPVRGPDDMGEGKHWVIRGQPDEVVKVRLEVDDGRVTVAVVSETKGEKVWHSIEGWGRHEYWLAFHGGPCTQMEMDPEVPGLFRGRGVVRDNYDEKFRGFCEFFNVLVDEDPSFAFYPEVGFASTGECIVRGPDGGSEGRPFTVKSWQVGAGFEVLLDLNAADRRRVVTWKWDAPPKFTFTGGVAVLET